MRQLATVDRIRALLAGLGEAAHEPASIYLTGGATAVLLGWRESTIDVDVKLVPERDELFRAIARLKETLQVNVELASPDLFIPVSPGWEERSIWEATEGRLTVRHFDLVAQALAKIHRGHERDLLDVREMIGRALATVDEIRERFAAIEPELYRFPAIDPPSFRAAVEHATRGS